MTQDARRHEADGRPHPQVAAGPLWAGGLATALIAVLVAATGVVVCSWVLDVSLLPPADRGVLGWSSDASYPAGAAVLALVATALLHLLLVGVPRPLSFFGWSMALVGVLLASAPFGYDARPARQVATAVVDVVVVFAVWTLLRRTAYRALVRRTE